MSPFCSMVAKRWPWDVNSARLLLAGGRRLAPWGHAHDTPSKPTAASQRLGGITASMYLYAHAADEVYHLDGTLGALGALVARLGTGALDGLLDALGGEDAKHHGDAR